MTPERLKQANALSEEIDLVNELLASLESGKTVTITTTDPKTDSGNIDYHYKRTDPIIEKLIEALDNYETDLQRTLENL